MLALPGKMTDNMVVIDAEDNDDYGTYKSHTRKIL